MSLDTVDVVHALEDATGHARRLAEQLRADASRDPYMPSAAVADAAAAIIEATRGGDEILAEWRDPEDEDEDEDEDGCPECGQEIDPDAATSGHGLG